MSNLYISKVPVIYGMKWFTETWKLIKKDYGVYFSAFLTYLFAVFLIHNLEKVIPLIDLFITPFILVFFIAGFYKISDNMNTDKVNYSDLFFFSFYMRQKKDFLNYL